MNALGTQTEVSARWAFGEVAQYGRQVLWIADLRKV